MSISESLSLAFLGYPEPDAGCPFGYLVSLEQGTLLISGVLNRSSKGIADVESQIVDASVDHLVEQLLKSGLHLVKKEYFLWWILQTLSIEQQLHFDELELMLLTAQPQPPHFFGSGVDLNKANRLDALVNQETGIFFLLSEDILADGVKGLAVAMQNDPTIRHNIIEAVVESTADLAVTEFNRHGWTMALLAISLVYDAKGMEDARNAAEHNRRAFLECTTASQIPFVRVWTNQQLVNSVAIAQLMARDSQE